MYIDYLCTDSNFIRPELLKGSPDATTTTGGDE